MLYMYSSELSPLSQYLTYPSEAPPSEKSGIDRITSTFNSLRSSLTTIKNRIDSAMGSIKNSITRNSLFGRKDILVKSENRGKFSDADKYEKYARSPVQVNEAGQKILLQHGFDLDDTKQRLSPKMVDRGKCFGGVNTFIADYLERQDIETTAKKFEGGIPMEGVLTHEIYKKAGQSYNLSTIALEASVKKIIYPDYTERFNPKEYLSEEQRFVLDNVKKLANKGLSPQKIDFTDTIEESYGKPLSPENRETLERTFKMPHLPAREQGIARLNGMEIDWTSGSKTAQEIVDAVKKLEPGAYSLSFPCTNHSGNITGVHTTSLIVKEGKTAYFYDPNYAVARTSDPAQTVGRVFKHYSGYGSSRFERIKNIFLHKANPPSTPLTGFSLSSYRKIEQL
jgi:hypothetical protein